MLQLSITLLTKDRLVPYSHFNYHFTACFLEDLWNLLTTGFALLSDNSVLKNAVQYQTCDTGSVGSVLLIDNKLNTATVVYYTGITPRSSACFVCDESSGYELSPLLKVSAELMECGLEAPLCVVSH